MHLSKGPPTNFIVLDFIAHLLCCNLFALVQGSLLPIFLHQILLNFYCAVTFWHSDWRFSHHYPRSQNDFIAFCDLFTLAPEVPPLHHLRSQNDFIVLFCAVTFLHLSKGPLPILLHLYCAVTFLHLHWRFLPSPPKVQVILLCFYCTNLLSFVICHFSRYYGDPNDISLMFLQGVLAMNGLHYSCVFFLVVEMIGCPTADGQSCFCFYNRRTWNNIQNCSSLNLHHLPSSLHNFTDWLILQNNDIKKLNDFHTYFETISFLNISENKISTITTSFLANLSESKTLKWLDLSYNDLKRLPPQVQELTNLEKIWLHGNPIHCDCDMTWMIDWINNFTTTSTREHVVVDHTKLNCHSGKMHGKPIYKLSKVDLGCYPHDWTVLQKLIVGLSVSIGSIIIVALVIVSLFSKRGRFLMYYYLKMDTITRDDRNEDLEDIEYDAFFCYRSVRIIFFLYPLHFASQLP